MFDNKQFTINKDINFLLKITVATNAESAKSWHDYE